MRPAIAVPWLKYEQVQDHHHDQENTSEASVGSMPLSLAGQMKSFRYERGRNNDVIVEQEQVLHKVADANGGKLSLVDRADLLSTRSELWLCPQVILLKQCHISFFYIFDLYRNTKCSPLCNSSLL